LRTLVLVFIDAQAVSINDRLLWFVATVILPARFEDVEMISGGRSASWLAQRRYKPPEESVFTDGIETPGLRFIDSAIV
jgi:hypothetical protein